MTTPIAVAAAPAAPATPAAPVKNGATHTETGQPPAADPKPNAAPAEKAPEQPWKVKRKLKIGGKEIEQEYDDRRLQILEHTAAQKAEFERERSEFQTRLKKLTEAPDELFEELGFNVDDYIAQRAAQREQMAKLTPEQQEIANLKAQIAKREAAEAKAAETAKAEAQRQADVQYQMQNAKLYSDAMALAGIERGKPGSASFLSHAATVRHMAHINGEPDLTPDQLAAHVDRYESNLLNDAIARKISNEGWRAKNGDAIKALTRAIVTPLAKSDPEGLLNALGVDMAKLIVGALHAKTRSSPTPIVQETPRDTPPPPQVPPKGGPSTWDEAAERFGF